MPRRRAQAQISAVQPMAARAMIPFSAHISPATPSGTSAYVSSVNSGPYAVGVWSQRWPEGGNEGSSGITAAPCW